MPKIKNQEDEFYGEMDDRTARRSCCSCKTLAIFFACLLIVAAGLLIYGYRQIKKINFTQTIQPSLQAKNEFFNKIKFEQDKEPTLELRITSEELTSIASGGFSNGYFETREVQIRILNEKIEIFGKMIRPFKTDLKIESQGEVEDGQIQFKFNKISAGKLSLPGLLKSEIEKSFNKMMDENFKELYEDYQVEKIELQEDEMIISGKLK